MKTQSAPSGSSVPQERRLGKAVYPLILSVAPGGVSAVWYYELCAVRYCSRRGDSSLKHSSDIHRYG